MHEPNCLAVLAAGREAIFFYSAIIEGSILHSFFVVYHPPINEKENGLLLILPGCIFCAEKKDVFLIELTIYVLLWSVTLSFMWFAVKSALWLMLSCFEEAYSWHGASYNWHHDFWEPCSEMFRETHHEYQSPSEVALLRSEHTIQTKQSKHYMLNGTQSVIIKITFVEEGGNTFLIPDKDVWMP